MCPLRRCRSIARVVMSLDQAVRDGRTRAWVICARRLFRRRFDGDKTLVDFGRAIAAVIRAVSPVRLVRSDGELVLSCTRYVRLSVDGFRGSKARCWPVFLLYYRSLFHNQLQGQSKWCWCSIICVQHRSGAGKWVGEGMRNLGREWCR